jgi:hypothetical protein
VKESRPYRARTWPAHPADVLRVSNWGARQSLHLLTVTHSRTCQEPERARDDAAARIIAADALVRSRVPGHNRTGGGRRRTRPGQDRGPRLERVRDDSGHPPAGSTAPQVIPRSTRTSANPASRISTGLPREGPGTCRGRAASWFIAATLSTWKPRLRPGWDSAHARLHAIDVRGAAIGGGDRSVRTDSRRDAPCPGATPAAHPLSNAGAADDSNNWQLQQGEDAQARGPPAGLGLVRARQCASAPRRR